MTERKLSTHIHIMNLNADFELAQKIQRRTFLKTALAVGAVSVLTSCDVVNKDSVIKRLLTGASLFNDDVQAKLFNSARLAPEYPESMLTNPFPFNAFYEREKVPVIDSNFYRLELLGLIGNKKSWSLQELGALPQVSQVTRQISAEGWSAIGKWSGIRFSEFLQRIGADMNAKFVGFKCADDYYTSIDMASAMHPQTLLALSFADKTLPTEYGFPIKIRIPTKLGYKNPKHVTAIYVTNSYPGGYWEDKGYNWFGGC